MCRRPWGFRTEEVGQENQPEPEGEEEGESLVE